MLRGVQCYTQSCSPYLKKGYLYTIKIKKVTKTPIIISEYYLYCLLWIYLLFWKKKQKNKKTQLLLNRETGSHKVCCSLSLHTVQYEHLEERNPRWLKQLINCATHGGSLVLLLLLCVFCWKDFREGRPLSSIKKQDYLKLILKRAKEWGWVFSAEEIWEIDNVHFHIRFMSSLPMKEPKTSVTRTHFKLILKFSIVESMTLLKVYMSNTQNCT